MWFMRRIMAVSGLLGEKGEQAESDHFGGKKPPGWLQLARCSAIFLLVPNFYTLSLFIPFFLTAYVPTPVAPQSLLPSRLYLPPFCLSFSVLSLPLQYFTELCVSVVQSVGICGALPVPSLSFFPLFLLCVGGLIPFSHCISTCRGNGAELQHFSFSVFFFKWGFCHREVRLASSDEDPWVTDPLMALDLCESAFMVLL